MCRGFNFRDNLVFSLAAAKSFHLLCCKWPGLYCVTGLRDEDMLTLSDCTGFVAKPCFWWDGSLIETPANVHFVVPNNKSFSKRKWSSWFNPVALSSCPLAAPVRHMAFGVPGGSSNMTYFVLCGGGLTAAVVYVSIWESPFRIL